MGDHLAISGTFHRPLEPSQKRCFAGAASMGGARGGGDSCPPVPSYLPPPTLVRIMTLGALQGFSIFCKKQLNVLTFLV